MKKQSIALICFLALFSLPIKSMGSDGAAQFLDQSLYPRAVGMGSAYTSLANGSDALSWNPAGITGGDMAVSLFRYIESDYITIQGSYGLSFMGHDMGFGVGYVSSRFDGVQETLKQGESRDTTTGILYGYLGQALQLGGSVKIQEGFTAGMTLKMVQEREANHSASGVGLDVGIQSEPFKNFKVGAVIKNLISPEMTWDTPSKSVDTLTRTGVIGIAYTLEKLTLSADFSADAHETWVQAGGEYLLHPMLPIRGGIGKNEWSMGTGLILGSTSIDMSYTQHAKEGVDGSYRLGLRHTF